MHRWVPMELAEVRARLEGHDADLQALGVRFLAVFGSVARGEAGSGSDVDLLVDFEGPADFDRFMDLRFLLEDLLAAPVDLVTQDGVRPELRGILSEAVHVA